ncbi:peroxiredoxin [Acetobacteraceae bacterium]|nr:peroxiredoxin [Acetobacteraceae bacterium]
MVKIGDEILDFETTDTFTPVDGKFGKFSPEDLKGKWSILFFYPADFTFVCPTELEDMADKYEAFKKLGVEVYSVSTDKHFTHKAWHDASPAIGKVKFPMVADPSGEISDSFDVLRDNFFAADRATFLIDPEGKIQYIEITSEGVGREADTLLKKVEAAQFVSKNPDQVCPAKWREGEKTLKPGIDLVGKI